MPRLSPLFAFFLLCLLALYTGWMLARAVLS
jgi:hypothetical protein